jgi:C4-dicarboxylate-specific signal transduction histidine kinase
VGLVFVALRLARNARDATHGAKSPRLMVDVYQADGHVVVEFKDNGSGEAQQDLGGAGSPFFRKSDRVADSADLGLMTCTELVEYMGGKIRVHSTPSKGTTVFVNLPSAQQ